MVLSAQQTEFLNFKHDNTTVAETVKKFEQLTKLCPYLVSTEDQQVKQMLVMLQQDVTLAIEIGEDQPTMTTDYVERAYRAEHCLNQLKENR